MCGIAGIHRGELAGPEDVQRVGQMLAELEHRGPDGRGLEHCGKAVLGHARLAIIDLETGNQPQGDDSGSIRTVVNGEIYNYRELRERLESEGCRFRTQSDIEVIPHLYRLHGDDFLTHLRGMFAIALHDAEKNRLLLARDRLGQKPLYFAEIEAGLAFASEARALTGLPEVDRSPDPEAIDLYLTYQYVPAPWSIYKGVRKLEAGTLLVRDADGRITNKCYWDPLPRPDASLTEERVLGELDGLLRTACMLRMRSDVPVATFLSGGVDSGLVTSYLAESGNPDAITVGFPGSPEDERAKARSTASALGLNLVEQVTEADLPGLAEEVLSHLDEPLGDSSCIPTWVVSRAAAERVKVVVSGDGGDESFAGYADRYRQNLVVDRARRMMPGGLRRPLAGALAGVLPKADWLPRAFRWKRVMRSLSLDPVSAYFLDMSIFRPSHKRRLYRPEAVELLRGFDASLIIREPFERAGEVDLLSRLLYVDRRTWLAEGVLGKVDRMSMAHSLEVRSPLLDHEVVEFAARIPSRLKLDGGVGKRCLRSLAARRLPREICRAPKAGFAPPLVGWLAGPLRQSVEDALLVPGARVAGLIESTEMRRLFDEQMSGRRNNSRLLWLLFVLETWARKHAVESLA